MTTKKYWDHGETQAFVSAIEEMVRDLCIKRTDGKVFRNAVLRRLSTDKNHEAHGVVDVYESVGKCAFTLLSRAKA